MVEETSRYLLENNHDLFLNITASFIKNANIVTEKRNLIKRLVTTTSSPKTEQKYECFDVQFNIGAVLVSKNKSRIQYSTFDIPSMSKSIYKWSYFLFIYVLTGSCSL